MVLTSFHGLRTAFFRVLSFLFKELLLQAQNLEISLNIKNVRIIPSTIVISSDYNSFEYFQVMPDLRDSTKLNSRSNNFKSHWFRYCRLFKLRFSLTWMKYSIGLRSWCLLIQGRKNSSKIMSSTFAF